MKAMLEVLVQGLVDNPGAVEIDESDDRGVHTYHVSVAEEDLGKVIGKDGKIANALRSVAKGVAGADGQNVHVDIRS